MKFYCKVDGIHFPQDFEKTFKPPCNFWGDLGFGNVSVKQKRKFWDWLFSMPSDEIAIEAKIAISVTFSSHPIVHEDEFKNLLVGYDKLSEKKQQDLQRELFKRKAAGDDIEKWIKTLGKVGKRTIRAD